jgi:putative FmdB family regulatory protein
MPIYEYRCRDCGQLFQKLQSMTTGSDGVSCPKCNSIRVERQLSAFASGSSRGSSGSSSSCAPSGGG